DSWHDNYEGAPADGSAWLEGGDESGRLLRGGAWFIPPILCRSAVRNGVVAGLQFDYVGLRVGRAVARTLS
ncbi:MAG: serine/threonine-protein kinase pkn1, partial [Spirulinaceae cyanobacterium RM2_2_10]|nr:serine/threonine-protein kinase pkn1 [Spirulinaceae cyanobacterium RM2_2_10]